MALRWTTVLIDRSSGSPVEQDVTDIHNYDRSQFLPSDESGQAQSTLDLSFVYTQSWNIQEYQEFWAGWRDDVTHEWSMVDAAGDADHVYGGYVGTSQGGADGPQHTFTLSIVGYDFDFDTTDIIVWPDLASYPTAYPDGFSAKDWLVGQAGNTGAGGTIPYDGLIPQRLASNGGYLLDGVDADFDSIIFGASTGTKPGVSLQEWPLNGGLWGLVDLRQAIDDVLAACRAIDGTKDPAAFVETAIDPDDPTKLRPRFRLVDRNAVSDTPVCTFASDAGVGEWQIRQPFSHTRQVEGARQRAVVWGPGTANGLPDGPLKYAVSYNAARPVQPTVYQTDPGRSGKPYFSNDVTDVTMAQALADEIEAYSWGPLGTLRFRTRRATLPGETVHVRIPPEGIDRNYRVAKVTTVQGLIREYDITIGAPLPDLNAMLQRRAFRLNALQQLAALGLPLPTGATGLPGAARRVPLHSTPQNPTGTENVVQAGNANTPGMIFRPPFQDPSLPPVTNPASPLAAQIYDSGAGAWTNKTWVSADDGRPHPAEFHLGTYTTDGTFSVTVAVRTITLTAMELAGTGSATLLRNGTAVSSAISGDGPHTLATPVTYSPSTGPGVAGDKIGVTTSGTDSADPLHIVVWER